MRKFKKIITIILLYILMFNLIGCTKKDDPNNNIDTSEYKYYQTELLAYIKDIKYLELLNCPYNRLTNDCQIKKLVKGELIDSSIDELLIGQNNLYVRCKDDRIDYILIDGTPIFNNIRVAIRNSINDIADTSTLTHSSITLSIPFDTTIMSSDGSNKVNINANSEITFEVKQSKVSFVYDSNTYTFGKRIIIDQDKDQEKEISVSSITRSFGVPSYKGKMEITVYNQNLLLINEVSMEDYLIKVVPSEMPTSWNIEALKAQAVAARTYAYKEIYRNQYAIPGYVVDDSTMSQVYNNQNANANSTKAINETKGITMFNNNEPIVAYYYSCESGLTGNGNEVWITDKVIDEIPYLLGKNLTDKTVDTSSEESLLQFFKTIKMTSPGGNSTNHRWKVEFSKTTLMNTLNANLSNMISQYPDSYLFKVNGEWKNCNDFTFDGEIGEIEKVYVSERGSSGVVVSLTIETSKYTLKIYNQYNIRFTLRPRQSDTITKVTVSYAKSSSDTYTSTNTNASILPSGYFAIETNGDNITLYGGGSGHGIGMSQYGANYYASKSYTYDNILKQYYSNIEFIDTSSEYSALENYMEYLKVK